MAAHFRSTSRKNSAHEESPGVSLSEDALKMHNDANEGNDHDHNHAFNLVVEEKEQGLNRLLFAESRGRSRAIQDGETDEILYPDMSGERARVFKELRRPLQSSAPPFERFLTVGRTQDPYHIHAKRLTRDTGVRNGSFDSIETRSEAAKSLYDDHEAGNTNGSLSLRLTHSAPAGTETEDGRLERPKRQASSSAGSEQVETKRRRAE